LQFCNQAALDKPYFDAMAMKANFSARNRAALGVLIIVLCVTAVAEAACGSGKSTWKAEGGSLLKEYRCAKTS
jgi:hypothetical protein